MTSFVSRPAARIVGGLLLLASAQTLTGCADPPPNQANQVGSTSATPAAALERTAQPSGSADADFSCPIATGGGTAAPPLPKPPYLGSVTDPVFGQRIVRITGDPGTLIPNIDWRGRKGRPATWGTRERHHYSLLQAWNADMSLMVLNRDNAGHPDLYLDGRTYEVLFARNPPGGGDLRWLPHDPSRRILVRSNQIGTWNPVTDELVVLATFPGYSEFQFPKGNPSDDGNRIAVHAKDPSGACVAFAYDLSTRQKFPDIRLTTCKSYVTISPSGDYILVHYRDGTDSSQIYDVSGRKVGPTWSEYGEPSHFDLARDLAGDEVAVGISKNKLAQHNGRQIMRRLSDGAITILTSGRGFTHTSARALGRPGWVYGSGNDIAAIRLDGSGTVQPYAQTRSIWDKNYWAEPQASPSPDGSRVVFASNWGDPRGPIGAYVVEICPRAAH